MSSLFSEAKSKLASLKSDPGQDAKLKLYAFYKQATVGKCSTSKPGITDFVGRAKWNAWNGLGSMSKQTAEQSYIDFVEALYKIENPSSKETDNKAIMTSIEFGNIYVIRFNRPKKFNAMNEEMYKGVIRGLAEAERDPNVVACCFTGNGNYYSSGNDLSNYTDKLMTGDIEQKIKGACDLCGDFVRGFIEFSKPLIALVNGPAVGISFTVLGLFDMVISSDKANFAAPFTKLALSPEGCSSYVFPKLMGRIKASEILMFNKSLSAFEAYERGLLTRVIASENYEKESMKILETVSKLPKESLFLGKRLIRKEEKETLLEVNRQEMLALATRFTSGEFMESVMAFMNKRSKL